VLRAVDNGASLLHRLEWDGSHWLPSSTDGFGAGKQLQYPGGLGRADSEGVAKAAWDSPAVYVATERNNQASSVSRPSILRFDSSATGTALAATHEWSLLNDLPVVGANLGLEAITFVPDALLVARSFFDESRNAAYDPALYPDHAGGLFFVGLEANGQIYAYALNHTDSSFQRIATLASGFPGLMDLEFDRDTGYLWAACDDTCGNQTRVFALPSSSSAAAHGRFELLHSFDRPASLPNSNNEGIALAPESECVNGQKAFYWSDDNDLEDHSLRAGSVPCGTF
jgi:hypothetical protein